MTEKLNPCPFCGGEATPEVEDNGTGCYWIICDNVKDGCGCEGPYRHSPDDARVAWNRRTPPKDARHE
jgi:hypothetical protein